MRVSYNWLRELLPGLEASPDEVAQKLAGAGLAVDGVTRFGSALTEVIVAKVLALEPHPKRSGLRLVTINRGGEQRVVCGASNVPDPGGLVVLAPLGAKLPGFDAPLAAREIGGVPSEGMLCSTSELAITEASDGILVLPPGFGQPGQKLSELLPGAVDTIYQLDITPNRPDALGHIGVARDLAALYGRSFTVPAPKPFARMAEGAKLEELATVVNQDVERCPHYGAGAVLDVKVGPSPLALQFRLESLGVRAISNVVDVTNWLLLLFGQPLHAFDLDRVRGRKIIVRRATAGEPFTTLDGIARKLEADDLVIADAEGPSALAGVMGGADSEIRETTQRVFLECAYFTPRGVRRTARRHGMHTESSHRFERGVDWGAVPMVLEHAKSMLSELAGGAVVNGAIHARGPAMTLPRIKLRSARMDSLLGTPVPFAKATEILSNLGFKVLSSEGNGAEAHATIEGASFRPDVTREVDLFDEIARVRGMDAIPTVLPGIRPSAPRETGKLDRAIAEQAVALGLSEALAYAFVSPKDLEKLSAPKSTVLLENPLSEERSVLRTSLLPGLLEALGRARRRGEHRVRLFCLGSVFIGTVKAPSGGARPRLSDDVGALPYEEPWFSAVLAGPRLEHLALKPAPVDVYDAKAVAEELVERGTGQASRVELAGERTPPHLHPRGTGLVFVNDTLVGRFGPLHPDVVDAFDLGESAQVVELNLDAMAKLGRKVPRYAPIPRLPAVVRDLSLVVKEGVVAGKVGESLQGSGGELCESIEVVADFRGGSVPDGHRSLTFRVVYRDPRARTSPEQARTLTDQEVDALESKMLETVKGAYGAALRA